MTSVCEALNAPQQEAVRTTEGPLLILAGAGSGKTRTLTHRIAYLIEEKGVDPWHILAITFTNKAAEEMKSRVETMTPQGGSVFVSTFHACCARILRGYADRLGYTKSFTIYDTEDQKVLMRRIIKDRDLDPKIYNEKDVLRQISSLKDEVVTAEEYASRPGSFREQKIAELYTEYQKRLLMADAMDFDDLLVNTVLLFRENEDVLAKYRDRFRYILVDEYQDTNTAQFVFVEMLAHEHRNLCVVGDDDQSIYKFRGANIGNILHFEEAFPGAKVIRLEQNYRSTKNILAAANQVISHNEGRMDKTLWSDKPEGDKVALREYADSREEAREIAKDIEKERGRFPYGACAVLYRTNSQSRLLEEAFVDRGIPYVLVGGTNFYERREIKDLLAYLKTVANAWDDVAVRRIINVPRRGIGDTTVEKVAALAGQEGITFWDALQRFAESPEAGKAAALKLKAFLELIGSFREAAKELRVAELIDLILDKSGYREALKEEGEIEAEARLENLTELQNKAAGLEDEAGDPEALGRFLEQVALVADVDEMETGTDRVTLMTMHSAKGLEFPKVYLAGMEQDLFPGARSLYSGNDEDLEEERRLCYVGFTRAQEKLILTAARVRMVNGQTQVHNTSQFVDEIDPLSLKKERNASMFSPREGSERQMKKDYEAGRISTFGRKGQSVGWTDFGDSFGFGEMPKMRGSVRPQGSGPVSSYFSSQEEKIREASQSAGDLEPGSRVSQKRYGKGTVVEVKQGKRDLEVTVDFDNFGRKVMLAGFAGFEKIEE